MKRFRLRDPACEKYFDVIVYGNLWEMRNAANLYDLKAGKAETNNDAYAVIHPIDKFRLTDKGEEIHHEKLGIIRFSEKHLSPEIVAHEVGHAALWQYRIEHEKVANFGEQICEAEETFIHIYGRLFRDVNRKLYKHNLWG